MQTRKTLLLFAHPALEKSRVNQRLLAAVSDIGNVTVHDLYEAYPDFFVDVAAEQRLLEEHAAVVCQHPFFWYSTPALLKQWLDLVLQHGWAYGNGGTALQGKLWLSVITTGGREDAYRRDGYNHFSVAELLAPLEQTVRLCGMQFLPPFMTYGSHQLSDDGLDEQASNYRRLIAGLADGTLQPAASNRT
jgi:glutathione-regulated potassium-efflux system ancillary protein KefG